MFHQRNASAFKLFKSPIVNLGVSPSQQDQVIWYSLKQVGEVSGHLFCIKRKWERKTKRGERKNFRPEFCSFFFSRINLVSSSKLVNYGNTVRTMVSRVVENFEVISSKPYKDLSLNLSGSQAFYFVFINYQSKFTNWCCTWVQINGFPIYSCGSQKLLL